MIVGLRSGYYTEGGLEHEPFWATKDHLRKVTANKDTSEGAPERLHCPMLGPIFGDRFRVLEDIDWTETVGLARAAHAKAGLKGEPVTTYSLDWLDAGVGEKRIDPKDGKVYDVEGFIKSYGGGRLSPPAEWNDAVTVAASDEGEEDDEDDKVAAKVAASDDDEDDEEVWNPVYKIQDPMVNPPDTCSAAGSKGAFITQELAQVAFLSYFFPDSRVEVLDSCNEIHKMVEPGYLDGFDLVVNYHSPYHALQLAGDEADWKDVKSPNFDPIGPNKFLEALEKTDASNYPPPFFNLNGDKSRIYKVLNQSGHPHVPFEWYQVPTADEGPVEPLAATVITDLVKNDWGCALLKPSFASFSMKLLKLCASRSSSAAEKDVERVKLTEYMQYIRAGIPEGWHAEFSALFFVESVGKNMQVREPPPPPPPPPANRTYIYPSRHIPLGNRQS